MKVSFAWITMDDQVIPEGETAAHAAELRRLQDEQQWHEGQLVLEGDGGSAPLRLADPLGRLIATLCVESVPVLAAGKEFKTDFYGGDGTLRLTVEGDDVVLSSEEEPFGRFRRAELLPALTDCAARYISAMRLIHEGNGWGEFVDNLEAELNAVRGQLGGVSAAGPDRKGSG